MRPNELGTVLACKWYSYSEGGENPGEDLCRSLSLSSGISMWEEVFFLQGVQDRMLVRLSWYLGES